MNSNERNCDKCVYGRRSGNCTAWNCKGTVTVEDIKAEARQSAIDEYRKEMHDMIEGNEEFTDWQKYEILECNELVAEQLKEGENNG